MEMVFRIVIQMSFYGLVAGAVACGGSWLLRHLPVSRRVGFLLWAVVGLRLICPLSVPSPVPGFGKELLSLAGVQLNLRLFEVGAGSAGEEAHDDTDGQRAGSGAAGAGGLEDGGNAVEASGAGEGNEGQDAAVINEAGIGDAGGLRPGHSDDFTEKWIRWVGMAGQTWSKFMTWFDQMVPELTRLWIGGVFLFWFFGIAAGFWFRRRLRFAMELEPGVYEVDTIDSSCVFGLFHPGIYLTPGLTESQKPYILCHEWAHIRHGDHLWKIVAYGIMGLHWFNLPLWGVYLFFQKEIERNCDETVVECMGTERRSEYCETLLTLATKKGAFVFAPPAFGERRGKNDMKDRIKQILKYQKPKKGIQTAAVAVSLIIGISLLSGRIALVAGAGSRHEEEGTEQITELADSLYALNNPYVGNAPGDGALVNALLPYLPITDLSMELETDQEPYSLILRLKEDDQELGKKALEQGDPTLDRASALLLALIGNLDQVIWEYGDEAESQDTQVRLYMDTKWASDTWNIENIKDYGASPEKVEELLELIDFTSTSIIGGADGPTSIWVAGKVEGDDSAGGTQISVVDKTGESLDLQIEGNEEMEQGVNQLDAATQTAIDFLIDFFSVKQSEADAMAEGIKKENQELIEQIRQQQEKQSESEGESGYLVEYNSETLANLENQAPFTLLNENAKNTLEMNRWIFLPYQLSAFWKQDMTLASCGLEIIYQEEAKARYEYTAQIRTDDGESPKCEVSGYVHLITAGTDKWVIDEVSVNILTEELQAQAIQEWGEKVAAE